MSDFNPKFVTLVEIFDLAMREYGDRPLFGTKTDGAWRWITYAEFGARVDRFRGGLATLGVEKGSRVGIISNNRPEWAVGCYATYGLGAEYVPMYESQLDKEWKYILEDCGAKVLIVANNEIRDRIGAISSQLPALEHVVVMDSGGDAEGLAFDDILARGKESPAPTADISPDDIAGFIYTSGTTGNPKGVRLSHRNLALNVSGIHEVFPMEPTDRSLSFLPWAHSFGQTVELHGLFSMGASMAIAESVEKIIPNLAEVRPTLLFSVPRIFNRIYDSLHKKMADAGGLKLKLFNAALANTVVKRELDEKGASSLWVNVKNAIFDKLIFSKVRELFGGRLRFAFSGGAALSKEVAEFVDMLGILVFEGYGLTETSPIASMNYPGTKKIGTVGKCIPGVSVEIDTGVTGDEVMGEIVIYGHNIMQGYHNLDEENEKVLLEKDGVRGFRSGDMGFVDDEGFLHITGRIKEQYKLMNGKYVVPTPLEERMKLSPFVANAMVYGMNREFNIALIIPDYDTLGGWCAEQGIEGDPHDLLEDERVRAVFDEQLEKYSAEFKGYERPKRFHLGREDFSTENGMLTPTLKLKRRAVLAAYEEAIDGLYKK